MKYTTVQGAVYNIPNEELDKIVKGLGCSQSDAISVWLTDHSKEVNPEQEALNQKANQEKVKHNASAGIARVRNAPPRKENPEKRNLVAAFAQFLEQYEGVENVKIKKPEREIAFKLGENEYGLTLTCHRK